MPRYRIMKFLKDWYLIEYTNGFGRVITYSRDWQFLVNRLGEEGVW